MKNYGHIVLSQDEEGLVRLDSKYYHEYRVNKQINKYSDHILCWGRDHKKIMQLNFTNSKKIISVGNTRIDLLKTDSKKLFKDEINKIKINHKDFILINGSFGTANYFHGDKMLLKKLKEQNWLNTKDKKKYQIERIFFQKKIFIKMIDLANVLAKNGHNIIVRPHPSENIDVWINHTKKFAKKIKIIRSGNVLPWLISAKMVIHNGYTTAIEGYLLKKTVIAYRPNRLKSVEAYLPNIVSIFLETKNEVINFIKNFNQRKFYLDIQKIDSKLDHYIEKNTSKESTSSKIMKLINKTILEKKNKKFNHIKAGLLLILINIKISISRIFNKQNFSYMELKSPKLDIYEVNKLLEILSSKKKRFKINTSKFGNSSILISYKKYHKYFVLKLCA